LRPLPLESLHNRLGVYGERWSLVAPHDHLVVPAAQFLDTGTLSRTLRGVAEHLGTSNLRAVASLWHKHYTTTLLRPILAAMTLAGVGLDGAITNVSVALDKSGLPKRLILHDTTAIVTHSRQDLQRFTLDNVRERHLALLIDQLRAVTGVSRRILWTNVANLVADLYDGLTRRPEVSTAAEDRQALLDSPVDLLTGGVNPLHNLVSYQPIDVPGLPEAARCRQACCERHLLPGYKPCYTCPRLSLEQRIAALAGSQIK
jgi:ferric iron reductase protein FhuF